MDDVPLSTGAFHGHLKRLAQQSAQSDELTAWVSKTLANLAPIHLSGSAAPTSTKSGLSEGLPR
jgi:hypothetical protein